MRRPENLENQETRNRGNEKTEKNWETEKAEK